MLSMEEAHRRDYENREQMHQARQAILTFLEANPSRLHKFTRLALEHAAEQLWEDMLRIDNIWD